MNQYVVAALAAVMSLVAGVILYKVFIPVLRKVKLGAVILEVGPNWHKSKAGTPIMGGVIFIISTAAAFFTAYFVLMDGAFTPRVIINSCMLLANAAIGFIDDYVKLFKKRNMDFRQGRSSYYRCLPHPVMLRLLHALREWILH